MCRRNNRHRRSLLFFGDNKMYMKHPKCSTCRKKAEFYYQKGEKGRKKYLCEDHGIEFMKKEKSGFLPRV